MVTVYHTGKQQSFNVFNIMLRETFQAGSLVSLSDKINQRSDRSQGKILSALPGPSGAPGSLGL